MLGNYMVLGNRRFQLASTQGGKEKQHVCLYQYSFIAVHNSFNSFVSPSSKLDIYS